eukprot:COSAG02_NODE_1274_length_13507_cov_8.324060_11_plen_228_part_01
MKIQLRKLWCNVCVKFQLLPELDVPDGTIQDSSGSRNRKFWKTLTSALSQQSLEGMNYPIKRNVCPVQHDGSKLDLFEIEQSQNAAQPSCGDMASSTFPNVESTQHLPESTQSIGIKAGLLAAQQVTCVVPGLASSESDVSLDPEDGHTCVLTSRVQVDDASWRVSQSTQLLGNENDGACRPTPAVSSHLHVHDNLVESATRELPSVSVQKEATSALRAWESHTHYTR